MIYLIKGLSEPVPVAIGIMRLDGLAGNRIVVIAGYSFEGRAVL